MIGQTTHDKFDAALSHFGRKLYETFAMNS